MAQTEHQLAANTPMLRATVNGKDYARLPIGQTSSQSPFKDKDSNPVTPTLTYPQYDEVYIITTDNADYLTDANNNVYELLVGSRPKRIHR